MRSKNSELFQVQISWRLTPAKSMWVNWAFDKLRCLGGFEKIQIAIKIYMKQKRSILLLSAFIFFSNLHGQKIFKNNDSSLSNFIQTNFFSETFIDSCYLGIHFVTIEPQKNGVFKVNISGNLNTTFKKRIEDLIVGSTKIWDKGLVDDCIKNNRSIVQPVLFDLNRPAPKVAGTGISLTTCKSITLIVVLAAEEEIPDIFAICIACSNAVSDGFELSYGTNILSYVIMISKIYKHNEEYYLYY